METAPLVRRNAPWPVTAVLAGLVLGAVDLLAQRTLAYPWANLANSSAVWAVAAYAVGVWIGPARWRAAAAGTLALVVAVAVYYVAAAVFLHDDLSILWNPVGLIWMFFGVLAGVVFGTAGAWSRGDHPRLRVLGCALPGAVLLAEAAVLALRPGDPASRVDSWWTATIEAVLGVVVVLLAARTGRDRLLSLATAVPLAVVGFGAFRAAGFGA
ncbi:DUF6518 family protein [Micromonosporaceae bacterium Da 78-11]